MDRLGRSVGAKLQKPVVATVGLFVAMAAAAVWLLLAGQGNTLHGDELFYYSHLVTKNGVTAPIDGLEYLFAPHNGHLVVLGRLAYELIFGVAGTDYLVFRIVEVAGVFLCAGLFFVLASRRTAPLIALALSISLITLGYANETLMWGFDLHTVYSAALGLGAMLALERDDRAGDVAACVLLILAVAMLEVGLAFTVGAAVWILVREDRTKRLWIFLVPLFLYFVWWLWMHKFGQSDVELSNVRLIPSGIANALGAVVGSLLGLNPTHTASPPEVVGIVPSAMVAAGFAVAGLVYRISRGNVPPSLWAFLATALTYWLTMAMGGRPPDSTRYIFVGAVLVLLVAVEAIRPVRFPPLAIAGFFCVVAFAIPPNVAKLNDGRGPELRDAKILGAEFAMLDLAHGQVEPGYFPTIDPRVEDAGGYLGVALDADNYFKGAARNGKLGMPLSQLRDEPVELRHIADATLAGAYGLALHQARPPADPASCPVVTDAKRSDVAFFDLEPGGVLLGSRAGHGVEVGASRFVPGTPGVPVGTVPPGGWAVLKIPTDAAPDPWHAVVNGPVYVCPLG